MNRASSTSSSEPARGVRAFAARAALFAVGGLALVFALDAALGWYTARTDGRYLVGREVYQAVRTARRADPRVRVVYLGDSVARQLFSPGTEPGPEARFLATNAAISAAGQCYLLEDVLQSCPNLRTVYLLMTPSAWINELDPAYTRDYFCGYFHRPRYVREMFAVKRNLKLQGSHLARCLLPNVFALNTAMTVRPSAPATAPAWYLQPRNTVRLGPVSRYYVRKMRRLCAERGITFRLLPCPTSSRFVYDGVEAVYDEPLIYIPDAAAFVEDGLHFRRASLDAVRSRMIETYAMQPYAASAARAQRE